MSRPGFAAATWRRSARSGDSANCVEVANVGVVVGLRDSKDRVGPVLTFSGTGWAAFLAGTKDGEFDPT